MKLLEELQNSAALIMEAYQIDFDHYLERDKKIRKLEKQGRGVKQMESAQNRIAYINRQRDRELNELALMIKEARIENMQTRGYKSMYNEGEY